MEASGRPEPGFDVVHRNRRPQRFFRRPVARPFRADREALDDDRRDGEGGDDRERARRSVRSVLPVPAKEGDRAFQQERGDDEDRQQEDQRSNVVDVHFELEVEGIGDEDGRLFAPER